MQVRNRLDVRIIPPPIIATRFPSGLYGFNAEGEVDKPEIGKLLKPRRCDWAASFTFTRNRLSQSDSPQSWERIGEQAKERHRISFLVNGPSVAGIATAGSNKRIAICGSSRKQRDPVVLQRSVEQKDPCVVTVEIPRSAVS